MILYGNFCNILKFSYHVVSASKMAWVGVKYHKCCIGSGHGKLLKGEAYITFAISNTTQVAFIPNFTASSS